MVKRLRFTIGVTIVAMLTLTYVSLNTDMNMGDISHPRPSHQPVSTRCSVATSGLKLCATSPIPPEFDLPDNTQNEWTYCGNANGPCMVNAYMNGEWVVVKLVKP